MFNKSKCKKCDVIRSGMLSPAILHSAGEFNQNECKLQCANNKPNVFVTRVAIVICFILVGLLASQFIGK